VRFVRLLRPFVVSGCPRASYLSIMTGPANADERSSLVVDDERDTDRGISPKTHMKHLSE